MMIEVENAARIDMETLEEIDLDLNEEEKTEKKHVRRCKLHVAHLTARTTQKNISRAHLNLHQKTIVGGSASSSNWVLPQFQKEYFTPPKKS